MKHILVMKNLCAVLLLYALSISLNTNAQTVYPNYRDGKIFVKMKNTATNILPIYNEEDSVSSSSFEEPLQELIATYGITKIAKAFRPRGTNTVDYIFKIHFTDTFNIERLLTAFRDYQDVEYAEKVGLYKSFCTNEQAGYWSSGNRDNWSLNMVNACNAFSTMSATTSNNAVTVAVVDNEFTVHSDFGPNFSYRDEADQDNNTEVGSAFFNHGTLVAGVAGADNNNNTGIASLGGVKNANNQHCVDILCVKATHDVQLPIGSSGNWYEENDLYDAIDYAAQQGAKVINCSWGFPSANNTQPMNQPAQQSLHNTMTNYPNFILVAGAGNFPSTTFAYPGGVGQALNGQGPNSATPLITVPNAADRVYVVANTDESDNRYPGSAFGGWVDIAAPGTSIISTNWANQYEVNSATSVAAPMVAALCGLVWYNNPSFGPLDVVNCINNAALPKPGQQIGAGRIDADLAVKCETNYNITYSISPDRQICANTPISFTQNTSNNLPAAVTITSYDWSFPGAQTTSSNVQNPTGIVYAQAGKYSVVCEMTLSNNETRHFNATINVLGAVEAQLVTQDLVCTGSEEQIDVHILNNEVGNTIPSYTLSYTINGVNSTYTSVNPGFKLTFPANLLTNSIELTQIQYSHLNNLTCPLNIQREVSTACCGKDAVVNGNFDLGLTGFTTNHYLDCSSYTVGNTYCIASAPYPSNNSSLPNRGNSLFLIGRAPTNSTPPFNAANPPDYPLNNPTPTFPNFGTEDLRQNGLSLLANHKYRIKMFTSEGKYVVHHPLRLRLQLLESSNNTNVVFSDVYEVNNRSVYQADVWHEYSPSSFTVPNNITCDLLIEQFENYDDFTEYLLDDIQIVPIFPYSITSPLGSNCLAPGATAVLTANPPTSGVTNYSWTGPPGGIIGATNTPSITVQLPGVYEVNSTNASPLANNCSILQAYYTVEGSIISLSANSICLPLNGQSTITANTVATTSSIINYSLNGGPVHTNPNFVVTTPGTYTVTATDANGCTTTSSIVIFTPTVTATQVGCTLVATPSGGTPPYTNYQWLGPSSGSGNPFTPSSNGIYTVSVTDANNCTATTTVSFSSDKIACCAPSLVPANKIFTSEVDIFNALGTNVWNETFAIDASITLNQYDFTFTQCTIYMAPDVEVTVGQGRTLIINDQSLVQSACNGMWKGITATQSQSQVVIEGSTIKNMEMGIRVESDATLIAGANFFTDNLLSIYLKNLPISYSGSITNNTFSTVSANLLPPYGTATRGNHGVFVVDCENVKIGNNGSFNNALRNTFQNLYNGIYIENTMTSSPNLQSRIYTSFNIFRNIRGGVNLWGSNSNGTSYHEDWVGSAIFGYNHVPAYDVKIFHHGNLANATPAPVVTDFEECDEAVLTNSFKTDVWQSHMVKCDAGCMFYGTNGLFYDIYDNKIEQAYAGIHFNGNTYSGNAARNEILDLQANPITKPGIPNHIIFYGRGIASHHFSSGGTSGLNFYTNTIKTKAERGIIGIDIFKAPPSVSLTTNYVYFESSSSNVDINTEPSLRGINLTLSEGARISHNEVYGLNTPGFLNNRHATGMYMLSSEQSLLNCNIFSYVRYGNYVVGDCNTGSFDRVNGNQHNAVRAGILFRHLGSEGQLGDIGNSSYDANNKFYGTNLLGHAHRLCGGGSINDFIYTAPFLNLTSDPSGACPMQLQQGTYPDIYESCNNGAFEEPQEMIGVIEEEEGGEGEGETEDVAGKNVIATGGKSMDDQELSEDLAYEPETERANPILNQFYSEEQRSAMAQLYETDRTINEIFSSASMADPELYNQNLQQAIALNNSVISTEPFELQERAMNSLFFKVLQGQSLTESEWAEIEVLANKCAYIDGYGVFKARTLYTMKVPGAHFDDLPICNKVGYNKGGKNPYYIENESLEALPKHYARQIHIYPNPAHTFVTIDFDYDANNQYAFEIYDMSGRRIMKESIRTSHNRINLMETATGIYTYKLLQGDVVIKSGKLIIE